VYDTHEIAWAAGLFEGEGSFITGIDRRGALRYPRRYPRVVIAMTDRDVIERFGRIMGFGNVQIRPFYPSQGHGYKRLYEWKTGRFEYVQATVALFWPYLGERRKAKAREILLTASSATLNGATCKRGHPWTAETIGKNGKARTCVLCRRARVRRRYQARKALHWGGNESEVPTDSFHAVDTDANSNRRKSDE
jgi:hypothetical protein